MARVIETSRLVILEDLHTIESPEALGRVNPEIDSSDYVGFIELAQRDARRGYTRRHAVTIQCVDSTELLPQVSGKIAERNWSITASSYTMVAGGAVLLFIVSGNDGLSAGDIRDALSNIDLIPSPEINVSGLASFTPAPPVVRRNLWHLHAVIPDEIGALAAITRAVVNYGGQIVEMAGHIETLEERNFSLLDINLTTDSSVDVSALRNAIDRVRPRLSALVWELTYTEVAIETPFDPGRSERLANYGISVVGSGKSDHVPALAESLAANGINIVGVKMAQLEAYLLMILLLEVESEYLLGYGRPKDLELSDRLQRLVAREGLTAFAFRVSLPSGSSDIVKDGETWYFYGSTSERPGLIAATSRLLVDFQLKVTRMRSTVSADARLCIVTIECYTNADTEPDLPRLRAAFNAVWGSDYQFMTSREWSKRAAIGWHVSDSFD